MRRQIILILVLFVASSTAELLAGHFDNVAYDLVVQPAPQVEAAKPCDRPSTVVCKPISNGKNQAYTVNLYDSSTASDIVSRLAYHPRYAILGISLSAFSTFLHIFHLVGLTVSIVIVVAILGPKLDLERLQWPFRREVINKARYLSSEGSAS